METTVRISVSELDLALIEKIKRLFGKGRTVTLTISANDREEPFLAESKKVYMSRLAKAIKNLEGGMGKSLSEGDLDAIVLDRLKG